MNLRKRLRHNYEPNTSSLNDIMFFLLLFFLITSTLVSPNVIKLLLPNSSSGKAVNKQTITISVSKDLRYFINSKAVSFDNIQNELSTQMIDKEEPTVILKVDKEVAVQNLVSLLDIGNKLKVKMVLATQISKG